MPSRLTFAICLSFILAACSTAAQLGQSSAPQSSAPPQPASGSASLSASAAPSSPAAPASPASSAASSPASTSSPSSSAEAIAAAFDSLAEHAFQIVGPAVVKITHGNIQGSGTIIDAKGYILTNDHVAEGATTYQVTLADNRTVEGKLVGSDPLDDLAVIQVGVPNLPIAQLGDSSNLKVAQTVLAIGNPIGFTRTITSGIVSALDRTVTEPADQITGRGGSTIPNMIQTDAPINPGNSGGALIDLQGRLIGVPTLAAADPTLGGLAQGIAFAVPINKAKLIVPQLISQGKVTHSGRAFLGVATQIINPPLARAYHLPVDHGAYVADVGPNTPAARAGLKRGDIIISLDGKPIQAESDLADFILQHKPGDQLSITYYSGSQQKTATATLVEAPASQS